jgi:O-antigen/teichoic acid export membrane protein
MNFFHAIGTPSAALLQGIGRNKELMYSEVVNAALNLLLSTILVQRIGLPGAALGTLVAHVCTSFWVVVLLPCRCLEIPLHKYLLSGILPPIVVGIPAVAIVWMVVQSLLPVHNFLDLGFRGALAVVIYIAMYLIVGATKEERQMYLRFVKGMATA